MKSLITEEPPRSNLTGTLVGIVSDPARLGTLHDILGSFCHQSRNVLNSMKMSMYLCRRNGSFGAPETWLDVESHYRDLEVFFDRLQTICRTMKLTPVRASLGLLLDDRRRSWQNAMAAAGRNLVFSPPAQPAIGEFDPARLGDALDAFAAWRAESLHAGREACVAWRSEDSEFHLAWDEPERGAGDFAVESQRASLAVPLLARVIAAHGGTFDVDDDDGFHVTMRWPLELRND